jgi:glycosyltransferase involved in cell wall biosynthesis
MKSRILLVNNQHYYGGGNSTDYLNTAALLREKGHEVAFFAMDSSKNLADPNADLFVSHIDFQELHGHKNLANSLKVLARVIYSPEASRKFCRLLERFQPDLVHLHNIHHHLSPSIIYAARKRKIPVIWRLHDYKSICPNTHYLIDRTGEICEACGKGHYFSAIFRRCKKDSVLASAMAVLEKYAHDCLKIDRHIAYFLAPSRFLQGKYLQQGFPEQKLKYLPLFVPNEMFQSGGSDEGYFLFLGKVEALKGVFPLLEAARSLPQIRLLLAGGVREPLSGQLAGLLPPNAEFLGMKDRKGVQHLLAGARALIVPSIWYENQPFVILEAFAAGKPVIASDLGGMTELVKHGERGLLTPPRDAEALAGAMKRLWDDPAWAVEMGHQAQEYARERHSAQTCYRELEEIYQETLGKRN